MKKFFTLALVGALVLGLSSVVYANVCAFDPVPAASLLFPFVAYDYTGTTATNTLFAITNVSSEAQIVHVTLWSDYSFPVLDFNIVLSGYDVQTVNIRDILRDGTLPVTTTDGAVWGEQPNYDGPVSHGDGLWLDLIMPLPEDTTYVAARCPAGSAAYPGNYAGGLQQDDLDTLTFYFTASQASAKFHDDCVGNSYALTPDDWWQLRDETMVTWLYITADVVWQCNRLFPDQPAYWTDQAMYQNVLIGDVFWVDDVANFSEADNAVHLEADLQIGNVATLDATGNPITFYYRYSTRNLVTPDYREPLPTAWAFRYLGVDAPGMDTYLRVWKGSTFSQSIVDLYVPGSFTGLYLAYDCLAYTYYAWDEDEGVSTVDESPWSIPGVVNVYPNLLPLETQEVLADEFNTPNASDGWFLFVWPNSNFDSIGAAPAATDWYQTWMGVKYAAFGKFSSHMSGAVMANFNCFSDQVLPNLGVNYDYVDATGYVESSAYGGLYPP
jgi:hypothetical protein